MTNSMARFDNGEVILISFPFTDLRGVMLRPAVVIFDNSDNDIVVARITSQAMRDEFDIEILEWEAAGLALPSIARVHKLATLDNRLVRRRLGKLSFGDWIQVHSTFGRLCDSLSA